MAKGVESHAVAALMRGTEIWEAKVPRMPDFSQIKIRTPWEQQAEI